jgi:hypothetical protein
MNYYDLGYVDECLLIMIIISLWNRSWTSMEELLKWEDYNNMLYMIYLINNILSFISNIW